jgi:hypothetical protein
VTVKKLPTSVELGDSIENIIIDNESPKLQQMRAEAAALQSLPQRERVRPLVDLVRKNIHYAYPWVMEELKQKDPDRAKWVEENTGVMSSRSTPITLSEIVDGEYAVCRHLSVVTLSLAKDAGLQGAHLVYQPTEDPESKIKNVLRKDTGGQLFQSVGVNESFESNHTWVDLLLDDEEWIPVDPSVQLTGETAEGMETFKEANYRGTLVPTLEADGLPPHTYGAPLTNLQLLPGEKTSSGYYVVNGARRLKPIRAKSSTELVEIPGDSNIAEEWPKFPRYQGALDFTLGSQQSYTGTNIELMSVSPSI